VNLPKSKPVEVQQLPLPSGSPSAAEHIPAKTLYDRLRANGKTGKQALVAVMNKLLK
jgi:hypothetical protein